MIIFIYGQDSYRSSEKLKEIISHYKSVHKSGLNLLEIDAKEKDFKDLFNNFKVASMFDEKKLIVIKNIFSDKNFQERFLEEIKNLKELKDIIVVYEKDAVDQRIKLFKALQKEAKSQEFKMLEGRALNNWVSSEFEKRNVKIDFCAQDFLLARVGNNLWQMQNEIKKLSNFKPKGLIKKEDVELLIKPKIEVDIFKTIDALAQKNRKQALSLLYKHIESGDNPLYLLSMMSYQFKNLLIIKDLLESKVDYAVIAKKSGLHPFVVKKTYYMCSQFSMSELKKIYQKIFQIDLEIKTGRINPEIALDLLIAGI